MKKLILFFVNLFFITAIHAQIFTLVDSIQFSQAQIWGVISDDGDSLCATTTFTPASRPHIYMRKISYATISQQSVPVQLTFDSDFTSIPNITDHKSIILNNEIYVSFSTIGDDDLFIFKTDINGNRIGSIVTVVASSPDPTNDMTLVTDGTSIFVLHFDPPSQQHVYKFDTNLNPIGSSFSTTTLAHNNLGNSMYYGNNFYMISGTNFGFNSNLILTRWDNSFAPAMASPQTILNSSSGDGNWFSTGEIADIPNLRWYVGSNHIYSNESIGQEHLDLLAFDDNFNLLERQHMTGQGFYRPHFIQNGNYLYVSYDRAGQGVFLHKYLLSTSNGIEENEEQTISIYPNPSNGSFFISGNSDGEKMKIVITDLLGNVVKDVEQTSEKEIMIDLPAGIYFVRINTNEKEVVRKIVVE